ncbi:MAG: septal ring lytic transglycosylase RlpA family lipoprotein [Deltaproteobacteria bacterium]|nr:MAG: septal ring lytic transglycosylase RlpA family lipoprotein [Deltaproteobacteria bacterium]PIE73289.1 MAG: septal ring lytic transglycosylase RlpA family lipoprotein [Deltaproteobacteria bacterium]
MNTPLSLCLSKPFFKKGKQHVYTALGILLFCLLQKASVLSASAEKPHDPKAFYTINKKRYYPIPSADGYSERGYASWYGGSFHGRATSSGETYDMHAMTAAHKTLPMNTMLLVKNIENGRQAVVRINDRGPFVQGRIIDLSHKAAQLLGVTAKGVAKVQITSLKQKSDKPSATIDNDLEKHTFYVQIGTFAQKGNATALQKRFTEAGHTAFIQKYCRPNRVLYRVQVYAGTDMSSAQKAKEALLQSGYTAAFVITR